MMNYVVAKLANNETVNKSMVTSVICEQFSYSNIIYQSRGNMLRLFLYLYYASSVFHNYRAIHALTKIFKGRIGENSMNCNMNIETFIVGEAMIMRQQSSLNEWAKSEGLNRSCSEKEFAYITCGMLADDESHNEKLFKSVRANIAQCLYNLADRISPDVYATAHATKGQTGE